MEGTSTRLERLFANALERNPQSRNILQAFQPIRQETLRLAEKIPLREIAPSAIDRMRLQGGVSVSAQTPLLLSEDPWDKIVRSMIPAISRGFPALAEELLVLQKGVDDGTVRLADFYGSPDGQAVAARWAGALAVRPFVIDFLLTTAAKAVLEKRRHAFGETLAASGWDKGYCPCCGSFPAVAVIHEKIPPALASLPAVRSGLAIQPYGLSSLFPGKPAGDALFFRGGQGIGDSLHLRVLQELPDHDQSYQ